MTRDAVELLSKGVVIGCAGPSEAHDVFGTISRAIRDGFPSMLDSEAGKESMPPAVAVVPTAVTIDVDEVFFDTIAIRVYRVDIYSAVYRERSVTNIAVSGLPDDAVVIEVETTGARLVASGWQGRRRVFDRAKRQILGFC